VNGILLSAILDPRQLVRLAELTPANAVVTVEHERRVRGAGQHAVQFASALRRRRISAVVLGMEAHAPAAAEDAVVALDELGERRPRRLVKSSNSVGGLHGTKAWHDASTVSQSVKRRPVG
jgi:hypothetical protein